MSVQFPPSPYRRSPCEEGDLQWADGTKTIVSCGAGDTYDYYAGFCAAVVKKLFGSTTHAKKVLGEVVQVK